MAGKESRNPILVTLGGREMRSTVVTGVDFLDQVALGNIDGATLVNKFGAGNLTTTLLPIDQDNTYPTPTTATALEFVSSSTDDDVAGTGAQKIIIQGLDANWDEVTQEIDTNGTTPVAIPTSLIRLYRWYVSQSGTYATQSAGSHAGTLTIRVAGAGATWSTIGVSPFPVGQSQIGVYSLARNKKAYLMSKTVFVDTTKAADIYFFQRPNADDVSAPYTGTMRLFEREVGVSGGFVSTSKAPKGEFIGPCDLGFMGRVSVSTAECSVEFQLLIVDI
jgi:hypothetical protein